MAPRFLAVATFGACVLDAVGAHAVLGRFPSAARWLTVALVASMLAYGIVWVRSASQSYGLTRNDAVRPDAFEVFDLFRGEKTSRSKIVVFARRAHA